MPLAAVLHPVTPMARSRATVTNIAGVSRRFRPVLPNVISASRIAANVKLQSANGRTVHGFTFGVVDPGKVLPRIVVATENTVVAEVAPGVTLVGLNVPVDAAGNPEAVNVTAFANPPVPGVSVIVKFAVWPAVTVTGEPGPLSVKSIPVPVSVAVCVVGDALSLSVRVAGPNDPVDGGVNVMLIMQFPPPSTLPPLVQVVPAATAKLAALVDVMAGAAVNVNVAPPVLVTVIDLAVLVVFTPWLVNESVFTESEAVAGVRTVVTSLAVSFATMISPPPETVAEFVTLAGALGATVTVRVIAG